ncbi:MAG TPA: HAMP domain-containing sensor histidine kinase [Myxococcaceae bacterium]|nr:HAMP domain-containing sensor histidine kinase [Myxococcaceae bacterium]
MRGGITAPLVAASVALAGSLGATFALHRFASFALDRELDDRLRGAGEAGSLLIASLQRDRVPMEALMRAHALDGAYVVDRERRVLTDAAGQAGRRVDLLRTDMTRLQRAFAGDASIAHGYALDDLEVLSGYFPIRDRKGEVDSVLVLDAGASFTGARDALWRSFLMGAVLSLIGAAALGVVAFRWTRVERQRQETAARASRGEALARMAAFAAHEIRNPLGVIRGTVELFRERVASRLTGRDRDALEDILGEVERLRRLTQDLLDLSSDRPLERSRVAVAELLGDAARATEREHPQIQIRVDGRELPPLEADPARLRQVFTNLLTNAAQAQQVGTVEVVARSSNGGLSVVVRDQGPGVEADIRERLFEPFVTSKERGTGLGLALSRRIVERHGGTLRLLEEARSGAAFEAWLPTEGSSG